MMIRSQDALASSSACCAAIAARIRSAGCRALTSLTIQCARSSSRSLQLRLPRSASSPSAASRSPIEAISGSNISMRSRSAEAGHRIAIGQPVIGQMGRQRVDLDDVGRELEPLVAARLRRCPRAAARPG